MTDINGVTNTPFDVVKPALDILDTSFGKIFERLDLPPDIQNGALQAYREFKINGPEDAQLWLCCAIYSELQQARMKEMLSRAVAARAKRKNSGDQQQEYWSKSSQCNSWNMSLSHLLRCFNIGINVFLQKMKHWNMLAHHSDTFKKRIENLQRRLSIDKLLLRHYKNVFQQLYLKPDASKEEDLLEYQAIYEFGWLLFLVVRNELPEYAVTNLITSFQLLVCTLELVYVNALEVHQSKIINREFPGIPKDWTEENFDILSLHGYCAIDKIGALIPDLPVSGVVVVRNSFFRKTIMMFFSEQRLVGNHTHMRELIKDGLLEVNLTSLNRNYATFVADINEMDERLFLKFEPQTNPKEKEVAKDAPLKELNSKLWMIEGHKFCEAQRMNLYQLLTHGNGLPPTLPTHIRDAIDKDDANSLTNIQNTLRDMALKFGTAAETTAHLSDEEAKRRFGLSSAIYYKLLDSIIKAELQRKPGLKITKLLVQRTFNATLIACCLELVLHICGQKTLEFPWVLECYQIEAFEFQKIIELVVRHHNGLLSQALIRHLQSVETECLATHIWRRDSQLWQLDKLPHYRNLQDTTESEDKENVPKCVNITHKSVIICMRKFYLLASQRLHDLCKPLGLLGNPMDFSHMWHIVEYSVTAHGSELLRQRHLDQLIICAIYMYGCMAGLRLTFTQILQVYRRQPYMRRSVYREVPMEGAPCDIIAFYNQVYIPLMTFYSQLLKCRLRVRALLQPNQKPAMEHTHRQISPNHNFYLMSETVPVMCDQTCNCTTLIAEATENALSGKKRSYSFNKSSPQHYQPKRPNILRRSTANQ
ncbi:retinoblastoma family protein [Scaptodrosophila lebanonensis]|uniref:Retinoblastoma family protein n=1 Tax=Drosophila lebanonensis TaxID=7225 RepID=A0A6J2TBM3_DROLE|nr:retinoblastoma family protein [Scaptodrosophila lebanonensis]XP_030374197.1 retinoblastoma family protein [Scaptodrosophila lebanonensis]